MLYTGLWYFGESVVMTYIKLQMQQKAIQNVDTCTYAYELLNVC